MTVKAVPERVTVAEINPLLYLPGTRREWKKTATGKQPYAIALADSLLELAEACDVPVRWSCRTGVCHSCETGLISGSVIYRPDPVEPPAAGNLLICCSQPQGDIALDL